MSLALVESRDWLELVNECVSRVSETVTDVARQGIFQACVEAANSNIYGLRKLRKSLSALPPDQVFGNPSAEIVVQRLAVILGNRHGSTMAPLPLCPRCHQSGIVSGVRGTAVRLCTPCKAGRKPEECFRCGAVTRVYARLGRIPYCQACWERSAPQRRRRRPCAKCGTTTRSLERCPSCSAARPSGFCEICLKEKNHVRAFPERLVCESCVQMTIRYPKPCSRCGRTAVSLFGRLDERLCSSCAGHGMPPFACKNCGTEDAGREGRRCFRCEKSAAIDTVLPPGHLPEEPLARLRALIDRPNQTARGVVDWCKHSKAAAVLNQMARGEVPATRATLNSMPQNRTTAQLHGLLLEAGILDDGDADLERYIGWSRDFLSKVEPTAERMLLTQFSRWSIERKLVLTTPTTRRSDTGRMLHARYALESATTCLTTIRSHGATLQDATQGDIDAVLVKHRQRREIIAFLRWAHENLTVQYTKPSYPKKATVGAPMPETDRRQQIARLLEDDSINLATRVAGLFLLVFGQSVGRISRLRTTSFTDLGGELTTQFGRDAVRIPAPMDELVRRQIQQATSKRIGTEAWLFLGYSAGAHLSTDALSKGLIRLGIRPTEARAAAMLDLAASMPARVLSDLMGYAHGTAERWSQLTGRTWATYPAMRSGSAANARIGRPTSR